MVEAKIRGAQDSPAITQNYETIVLKPHVVDGVNVISQQDVAGNNKKFVIKWGFTLTENLVFGVGCILDFDGGFFANDEAHNYTITGNNTRVILNTDEAACLKGVYKGGTWLYPEFPLSPDEFTRDDDVIVIGEEAIDTSNLKEKAVTDDKMSPGSVTRHAVSRNPENSIADNEDLTVNENGQLQLADKEYSPTDFSGLGRVYLRKNIVQRPNIASGSWITYAVDGITYLLYWYNDVLYNCHKVDNYGLVVVNHIAVESAEYDVEALPDYAQLNSLTYTESGGAITITLPNGTTIAASSIYDVTLYPYVDNVDNINMLTQDMMPQEQTATIYIIQYDFTLGEDITVPANCVLDFQGGSVKNGTIVGSNTRIEYNGSIFTNIVITGDWIVPVINADMFTDITDVGNINKLFSLTNNTIHNTIVIPKKDTSYKVNVSVLGGSGIVLHNKIDIDVIIDGIIELQTNNIPDYKVIDIVDCSNILVHGSGSILGDKDTHDYNSWPDAAYATHEWGRGIHVLASHNITISDIEVERVTGDCITIRQANNIEIKNCTLHNARRQGITLTTLMHCSIHHNKIYDIVPDSLNPGGPGAALDCEPDVPGDIENINISENNISNVRHGIIFILTHLSAYNEKRNIVISNNAVDAHLCAFSVSGLNWGESYYIENVEIKNNNVRNCVRIFECDYVQFLSIENNSFKTRDDFPTGGDYNTGAYGCRDVSILNNYMELYFPLFIFSNNVKCLMNSLRCKVDNKYHNTVILNGATNVIFGGNTCFGNIKVQWSEDILLTNNKFYEKEYGSLDGWLLNINAESKNIRVEGNLFDQTDAITEKYREPTLSISGNTVNVVNNHIIYRRGTSGEPSAIYLSNTSLNVWVKGNTFESDSDYNAVLDRGTDNYFDNSRESYGTARPTGFKRVIGVAFFDTTLGKPIYWNGSAWVDATGTPV